MRIRHGIFRVATATPPIHLADPSENAKQIIEVIGSVDADCIVFPELCLTGYTCGDLFARQELLDESLLALTKIAKACPPLVIVGLPLSVDGSLMNVAAVLGDERILGLVPKSFLPNYREFYEARHFRAASETDPKFVSIDGKEIPFGTDLLFQFAGATVAVEVCEDFWTPIPPSSQAALAGADVLVNLSASNETIGKADWRRELVRSQSGRCIAAYVYTSSGPTESTSDLVFGGHQIISENGSLLADSRLVGPTPTLQGNRIDKKNGTSSFNDTLYSIADVDLDRLHHDRRVTGSFDDARTTAHRDYRKIEVSLSRKCSRAITARKDLQRRVDPRPFVPDEDRELALRCEEIFDIQTAGLVKRLSLLPPELPLAIGISGGLDSTLALLVLLRACDMMDRPRSQIVGATMPGFGTTSHTRQSADELIHITRIQKRTIDIRSACLETFLSIGHSPLGVSIDGRTTPEQLQQQLESTPADATDLVFENVQARTRTLLLMSMGFVIGTGDLSEQALGWSTYNADHMSMYNVNTSVPKTLVRFLVRHVANLDTNDEYKQLLHRIADTPISPELLPPGRSGEINQKTEDSLGSYELHDFFLYHFLRHGADREKILFLAQFANFAESHDEATIAATYDIFERRFYASQFKRNCVPDGPKVGSVSLSPRGDWRMPADLK